MSGREPREHRVGRMVALVVALPFLAGFATAAAEPGSPRGEVEFTFTDPDIVESSGLVARDGLFATVNDSGDSGRVFTVDPASGDTIGVTSWGSAVDVEAVAPVGPVARAGPAGGGEVLVGDIGDNARVRDSVRLLRVPTGRGDRDVTATAYDLVYPDGPQDAETLLVHPTTGRVFVVTKGIFGGVVHAAPTRLRTDQVNRLEPLGDVLSVATDGAFFPDGRHVVVRDYSRAVVYTWPRLENVGEIDLPEQQQGEGIAVDEEGTVFVSSEGMDAPVLRVALPRAVEEAMDESEEAVTPSPSPVPDPGPASEPSDAVTTTGTPVWAWALGGLVGLGIVGVLVGSLRPR